MFSALKAIKDAVLGEDDDTEENRPSLQPPLVSEEKEIDGVVTSINDEYGMIDGEIYFTMDAIEGNIRPKEGMQVHVRAQRKHVLGGWTALKITAKAKDFDPFEDDFHEEPQYNPDDISTQTKVCIVTQVTRDSGMLDGTVPFPLASTKNKFEPCVGDVVKAVIESNAVTNSASGSNIEPVRVKEFEGVVTIVGQGSGTIDNDIHFTFGSCRPGSIVRKGDNVIGCAVESSRGKAAWRATWVEKAKPKSLDAEKLIMSPVIQNSPTQLQSVSELLRDKQGVSVADSLDAEELQQGQSKTIHIPIRNDSSTAVSVVDCVIHCPVGVQSQWSVLQEFPVTIQANSETSIPLSVTARHLGQDRQLLIIHFPGFLIGRYVRVRVSHALAPAGGALGTAGTGMTPGQQYAQSRAWKRAQQQYGASGAGAGGDDAPWIIPGQQLSRSASSRSLPVKLGQYPVPSALRKCVLEKENPETVVPELAEELTLDNYSKRFSTLLHLEEIQEDIDIRRYDLERVCLTPCREYLSLDVPGLAEGRPSLLLGDRVILSEPSSTCDSAGAASTSLGHAPQYEGVVHEVRRDAVLLRFHADFHQVYAGEDYNARFSFNRTTLRRCHQSVNFITHYGSEILFPSYILPKMPQIRSSEHGTGSPQGSPRSGSHAGQGQAKVVKASPARRNQCPLATKSLDITKGHKFYNERLNARQKAAVVRILAGQSRPTPYLLFGPPGTGKTVTVVEAIVQVFLALPHARILVSAPANSAADLLCERLHLSGKIQPGDMVRLNAFNRDVENLSENVAPYSKTADDLASVARHRIVVCTCSAAGSLNQLGLPAGHFTHAFVDEAGQATEPECMVPLGLAAGSAGQLVLAGDPMQLGPVLQSKVAGMYGLQYSFLERLIHRPIYSRDEKRFADHGCYDPLLVTKLVQNYRSHPGLLSVPSRLFYHDELLPSGPHELTHVMMGWDGLNSPSVPMIFHGLRGEDLREEQSPSWFNPVEAVQVMHYLQSLTSNTHHPLSFSDIGIITPYRKQVEKIRLLINRLGMEEVKVGSVEEFQGQERQVIVISMVRSNERLVGMDVRHNLGFLSNPKRFNVAVTRAQALLIVIGNPHLLARDENWRELLEYAVEKQAYVGCDLPEGLIDGMARKAVEKQRREKENLDKKKLEEARKEDEKKKDKNKKQEEEKEGALIPTEVQGVGKTEERKNSSRKSKVPLNKLMESLSIGKVNPKSETKPEQNGGKLGNVSEEKCGESEELETVLATQAVEAVEEYLRKGVQEEDKAQASSSEENGRDNGRDSNGGKAHDQALEFEVSEPRIQLFSSMDMSSSGERDQDDACFETFASGEDSLKNQMFAKHGGLDGRDIEVTNPKLDNEAKREQDSDVMNTDAAFVDKVQKTQRENNTSLKDAQKIRNQENQNGQSQQNGTEAKPPTDEKAPLVFDQENNIVRKSQNTSSPLPDPKLDASFELEPCPNIDLGNRLISSTPKKGNTEDQKPTSRLQMNTRDSSGMLEDAIEPLSKIIKARSTPKTKTPMTKVTEPEQYSCSHNSKPSPKESSVMETDGLIGDESDESADEGDGQMMGRSFTLTGPTDQSSLPILTGYKSTEDRGFSGPNASMVHHDKAPASPLAQITPQESGLEGRRGAGEISPSPQSDAMGPEVSCPGARSKSPGATEWEDYGPPSDLEKKIIRQMEYYFGDFNLLGDEFLNEEIAKDEQRWVNLSVLVTFNRLKELSEDFRVITTALKKSSSELLEVHPNGDKVRRREERRDILNSVLWINNVKMRSIAVENVRKPTDKLITFYEQFAPVEHIERKIPRLNEHYKYKPLGQLDLIIFYKASDAQKVFNRKPIKMDNRTIYMHYRNSTLNEAVEYLHASKVQGIPKKDLQPVGTGYYLKNPPRSQNKDERPRDTTEPKESPSENNSRSSQQKSTTPSRKDSQSVQEERKSSGRHSHLKLKEKPVSSLPQNPSATKDSPLIGESPILSSTSTNETSAFSPQTQPSASPSVLQGESPTQNQSSVNNSASPSLLRGESPELSSLYHHTSSSGSQSESPVFPDAKKISSSSLSSLSFGSLSPMCRSSPIIRKKPEGEAMRGVEASQNPPLSREALRERRNQLWRQAQKVDQSAPVKVDLGSAGDGEVAKPHQGSLKGDQGLPKLDPGSPKVGRSAGGEAVCRLGRGRGRGRMFGLTQSSVSSSSSSDASSPARSVSDTSGSGNSEDVSSGSGKTEEVKLEKSPARSYASSSSESSEPAPLAMGRGLKLVLDMIRGSTNPQVGAGVGAGAGEGAGAAVGGRGQQQKPAMVAVASEERKKDSCRDNNTSSSLSDSAFAVSESQRSTGEMLKNPDDENKLDNDDDPCTQAVFSVLHNMATPTANSSTFSSIDSSAVTSALHRKKPSNRGDEDVAVHLKPIDMSDTTAEQFLKDNGIVELTDSYDAWTTLSDEWYSATDNENDKEQEQEEMSDQEEEEGAAAYPKTKKSTVASKLKSMFGKLRKDQTDSKETDVDLADWQGEEDAAVIEQENAPNSGSDNSLYVTTAQELDSGKSFGEMEEDDELYSCDDFLEQREDDVIIESEYTVSEDEDEDEDEMSDLDKIPSAQMSSPEEGTTEKNGATEGLSNRENTDDSMPTLESVSDMDSSGLRACSAEKSPGDGGLPQEEKVFSTPKANFGSFQGQGLPTILPQTLVLENTEAVGSVEPRYRSLPQVPVYPSPPAPTRKAMEGDEESPLQKHNTDNKVGAYCETDSEPEENWT